MGTKDINIELKDETHSLAKVCAVLKNKTMKQYLQEAIEKAVEKDKDVLKKLQLFGTPKTKVFECTKKIIENKLCSENKIFWHARNY